CIGEHEAKWRPSHRRWLATPRNRVYDSARSMRHIESSAATLPIPRMLEQLSLQSETDRLDALIYLAVIVITTHVIDAEDPAVRELSASWIIATARTAFEVGPSLALI